jgi:hypothetical protein
MIGFPTGNSVLMKNEDWKVPKVERVAQFTNPDRDRILQRAFDQAIDRDRIVEKRDEGDSLKRIAHGLPEYRVSDHDTGK